MTYASHPHIARVRMEAVRMVEQGQSMRSVARYFGYHHTAVMKWIAKARVLSHGARIIPTLSCRPHHHPHQLSDEMVTAILRYRNKYKRCAVVLKYMLQKDGYVVSESSVKRVLHRYGCSRYSKWKKWHTYPQRPLPKRPGILLEIDTIDDGPHTDRIHIYALLDVCARWAYAIPTSRANTHQSILAVHEAQRIAPFPFRTIQSDHGSEFSKYFTKRLLFDGIEHRHSRVRKPTDNGHVERFNRTLQEECLSKVPRTLEAYRREIPEYLRYYNYERPHMGLDMKTPMEVVSSY